jgi:hypothetical protein
MSLEKSPGNLNWAQYFIEILVFCIKSHGFRIRQFLIQNKVFVIMLKTLKLKKKSVNLAIIKLFKSVLASNDEVLVRYIHSNGLILEVGELLFEQKGRFNQGNLLFSCCLELFEMIYKQNLKKFIKSICENEGFKQKVCQNPLLKSFFQKIFVRYEQYKEEDPFNQMKPNNNNNSNNEKNMKNMNEIEMKENKNLEELAYFENDLNENCNEKNEVFNNEEMKEKKEHLLGLQNKIKRKLEKPEDEGLVMKKVNIGQENGGKKVNFSAKIDIVFQDKGA